MEAMPEAAPGEPSPWRKRMREDEIGEGCPLGRGPPPCVAPRGPSMPVSTPTPARRMGGLRIFEARERRGEAMFSMNDGYLRLYGLSRAYVCLDFAKDVPVASFVFEERPPVPGGILRAPGGDALWALKHETMRRYAPSTPADPRYIR